jgi:hypothetical protein
MGRPFNIDRAQLILEAPGITKITPNLAGIFPLIAMEGISTT